MKICPVCDKCFEDSQASCFDPAHEELKDGPHSVNVVPGYTIERVIASYPKAVVYEARQSEYGQSCTISIVEPPTTQFLADADVVSRLFHPGVASVVESGEISTGSAFAVFEAFRGTSLRELIQSQSLSLLDQIRIIRQAAEAIHAIHSAGLIHGALQPGNISVEGHGTDELSIKVHKVDIGGAFANCILSNRFAMDLSLGDLRYFAPERFRGEPATLRSDVYSLGILLYEILSGHPPFEASSSPALANMHLNQKPPEIKIENFDLRMLLTHTISEALQKQASFRQSTADLFARQIRHIEQLATHVSTPPPAVAVAASASPISRPIPQQPFTRRVENVTVASPNEVPRPVFNPAPREIIAAPIASSSVAGPEQIPAVHPVRVDAPMPFVPVPKRSRLKGMKKRVHSYVSDAKAALDRSPTLIDWKTQKDDVPSIEVDGKDLKAAIMPAPTLIDWQQPEDDIPSIDAVREELVGSGDTVAFEAYEEIPEVRIPAKRIEVQRSEPIAEVRTLPAAERASSTFPSLLATADNTAFLGYQPRNRDLGKLPIYGVALFALVIVGFGVVRLGTALADDSEGYIGETRPSRIQIRPATTPIETAAIEPQAAVLNIQEQPVTEAAPPETPLEEPTVAKQGVSIPKEKVVETSATSTSKPSKRSTSEELRTSPPVIKSSSSSKDPFVPSTIVITRGSSKPKAVVVKEDPARESRPAKVGSGATRPRIVSLPN